MIDETDQKERFAYALRRARERLRMTPPQLAEAIGVTRGTVNKWENPLAKDAPSILMLGRICYALRADPRLFAVLPREPASDVDDYLVDDAQHGFSPEKAIVRQSTQRAIVDAEAVVKAAQLAEDEQPAQPRKRATRA